MVHKFDSENKHRLDNEQRREIMPPYETLVKLGLKKSDIMADIGCGTGYFTIPAADILEGANKVYAMDTSFHMLQDVEQKSENMGLSNIVAIKVDEYDLKTDDELFTFLLMSNVLHEIEDKDRFLKEIARITVKGGRLAVIEWVKKSSRMGPPENERIERDNLTQLLKNCRFEPSDYGELGQEFYYQVSVKL